MCLAAALVLICLAARQQVQSNGLLACGWYHGALPRDECEARLMQPDTKPGDYLVRESGSVDGYTALSIRTAKDILHFLIKEMNNKYFIGQWSDTKPPPLFSTIPVRNAKIKENENGKQ
jgi:hypothetical protein